MFETVYIVQITAQLAKHMYVNLQGSPDVNRQLNCELLII